MSTAQNETESHDPLLDPVRRADRLVEAVRREVVEAEAAVHAAQELAYGGWEGNPDRLRHLEAVGTALVGLKRAYQCSADAAAILSVRRREYLRMARYCAESAVEDAKRPETTA